MKNPLLLPLLLSILCSHQASAFINVEALRNAKDEGEKYQLSLTLSGKSGNTENSDYLGEAVLFNKNNEREYLALLSYKYGKNKDIKDEDKILVHLRNAHKINPLWSHEIFTQYEKDEFTRLSFRGLLGTGLRYKIYKEEKDYLFTGVGLFYSSETLEEKAGTSDQGTVELGRGNLYLALSTSITDNISFSSVTYFQPNFQRLNDHRAYENLGLNLKVEERLTLTLFLRVAHDNEPPELVKTTESHYGTKLVYLF